MLFLGPVLDDRAHRDRKMNREEGTDRAAGRSQYLECSGNGTSIGPRAAVLRRCGEAHQPARS